MKNKSWLLRIAFALVAGFVLAGWYYLYPSGSLDARFQDGIQRKPVPVEVAAIVQGPVQLTLTLTGTLEARAEFVAAPKVGGRIRSLAVDLSDTVKKGQVIAELDSEEAFQAVLQAKADLAVANATQIEAQSSLKIAIREFERVTRLQKKGIASDSQYDAAMSSQLIKQSLLEVAKAQVMRANALLEAANIRLGYSRVTADWPGSDDYRLVAERYVDAGQTVAANTPLVLISSLEPITGIVHVTEKDYASLSPGQTVSLTTDAYPKEIFHGKVDRISPVFNTTTRQARAELTIANSELRLKPGMFIRVSIGVKTIPNVTLVPELAITSQNDQTGVFVVNEPDQKGSGLSVSWCPVIVGIIENRQAQVDGRGLAGRVVVLGQHLLNHGAAISIPDQKTSDTHPDIMGNGK
ncbi:MAG: efflux RND transporter periplasmic adaptor subunit [Pseudomonadota bacterium]